VRRGVKIAIAVVGVLCALLVVNTIVVDHETKPRLILGFAESASP
jgi:hypothetical protein